MARFLPVEVNAAPGARNAPINPARIAGMMAEILPKPDAIPVITTGQPRMLAITGPAAVPVVRNTAMVPRMPRPPVSTAKPSCSFASGPIRIPTASERAPTATVSASAPPATRRRVCARRGLAFTHSLAAVIASLKPCVNLRRGPSTVSSI